jgi:hypothetical protein
MTEAIPTVKETIDQIKSRGFWEVIIRPLKFDKDHIKSLSECIELILGNKVRLRGWDYPHISNKYGIKSGTDWIENLTDWSDHKEYWRMYRSGQFFHLFGCREDWWGEVRIFWSQQSYTTPGYGLSIMSTLYTLTEIYEFAARLAKRGIFDDFLKVSITLNGTKNRRLVTLEINRSLNDNYICNIENISLSRTISPEEIIGKGNVFAIDDTLNIFERFNWFNAPRKVLEEEQDKFIKGNL